jgi:large subunit ribosomal protein L29
MENKDIVALSIEELKAKIAQERSNLGKIKLGHTISPIESPIKIRDSRKTIARLATELTKRNKVS